MRAGGCIQDVPHLGFGFAAKLRGNGRGGVDLEGEPVAGIEQLDQQREPRGGSHPEGRAHNVLNAFALDQLPEGFPPVGAVGDDGLRFGAIHDFPGLADDLAGRERLAKAA